jgi:hypothetical protein
MPTSLHAQIDALAHTFTSAILAAIKGATLDELVGETAGARVRSGRPQPKTTTARPSRGSRRLKRRSTADIANEVAKVVATVKASKSGMRAEEIRAQLKLDKRELPRLLQEALAKKLLKKKGEKRATTYSVAGS